MRSLFAISTAAEEVGLSKRQLWKSSRAAYRAGIRSWILRTLSLSRTYRISLRKTIKFSLHQMGILLNTSNSFSRQGCPWKQLLRLWTTGCHHMCSWVEIMLWLITRGSLRASQASKISILFFSNNSSSSWMRDWKGVLLGKIYQRMNNYWCLVSL